MRLPPRFWVTFYLRQPIALGNGFVEAMRYAASMRLELGGDDDQYENAGWGVFPELDQRLVLTDPNCAGVSNWRLPRWFFPDGNKPPLTYHPDRKRWRRDDNHAYLQSVGRGQEFVLDIAHYPQATDWLSDLVNSLGSDTRK